MSKPESRSKKRQVGRAFQREASFESLLFSSISKEDLVKSIKDITVTGGVNAPQVSLVVKLAELLMDREKRTGTADLDSMSLLDVTVEAVKDDEFIETIGKALDFKKKMMEQGISEQSQVKSIIKQTLKNYGTSQKDLKAKTRNYLDGSFDAEAMAVESKNEN